MSLAGASDVENEGSDYRTSSSRPSGLRVGLTGRTPSNGGFKRLSQDKLALWDNVPSKSKTHHDSDSDMSDIDHFLTKGAFLLTPSHDLSMDRAAGICEKMNFRGCFSLTKTATGILFKFSDTQDYQAVFRKGFHKVTGARFYRKVPIPCRPQKTFILYVLDVPENLPEEDIRHSLYKFSSVVEVVRLYPQGYIRRPLSSIETRSSPNSQNIDIRSVGDKDDTKEDGLSTSAGRDAGPPPIRVTVASHDEYKTLLQSGLDFYGATFFPTETVAPACVKLATKKGTRLVDGTSISGRVRDLLPVFDAEGFSKIPPPPSKLIKPRPS